MKQVGEEQTDLELQVEGDAENDPTLIEGAIRILSIHFSNVLRIFLMIIDTHLTISGRFINGTLLPLWLRLFMRIIAHGDHIWSILQRLVEVANVANHVLVA